MNAYLAEVEAPPALDWEWMMTAGIAIGSLLSARASNDSAPRGVPALWTRRFGPAPAKRHLGAFFGGCW